MIASGIIFRLLYDIAPKFAYGFRDLENGVEDIADEIGCDMVNYDMCIVGEAWKGHEYCETLEDKIIHEAECDSGVYYADKLNDKYINWIYSDNTFNQKEQFASEIKKFKKHFKINHKEELEQ
jgi:hypothetical protein